MKVIKSSNSRVCFNSFCSFVLLITCVLYITAFWLNESTIMPKVPISAVWREEAINAR